MQELKLDTNSAYIGKDNLDIMSLAINYNNSIFQWLQSSLKNSKRTLDFGAGKGEFCNRIKGGIYAVELDFSMHESIVCETKRNIDEFDGVFDLIYSLNVLEHIENDFEILEKFYHKLNEGAYIKILVPAKMELFTKMDENVGHIRRYEKRELVEKIQKAGFKIKDCRYFDFIGYFATLVYKYIDNSGIVKESSLKTYDKYIFPISKFIDRLTFGRIVGKNLMLEAIK